MLRAAILASALAATGACGSSSTSYLAPTPSRCAITASASATAFPPSGGSGTLQVSAARECSWAVQSAAAWIVPQAEARGQGDGTVRFTIAANSAPATRAGALSVSDWQMQISQEGEPCRFRLSSTHETVDGAGGERTIEVEASHQSCSWSISVDVPWITVPGDGSRTGSSTVLLQVAPAPGVQRSATLTVAGQTVTLEQVQRCTAAPRTTLLSVSPAGGRFDVPVAAAPGCAWSARSEEPWIAILSGQSGTGDGFVTLAVAATSGSQRTGAVQVAGHTVRVVQETGCDVAPATTAATVGAAGGRIQVPVVAGPGCAWSARSEEAWITIVSGHTGTGDGVVTVDVAATSGSPRTGSLLVAGHPVRIAQESGCSVAPATTAATVGAAGGTVEVPVQAGNDCPWTARSDVPWITVTAGGRGPAPVVVSVAASDGPLRTGTVNVAGTRITVTQLSGCRYDVQPLSYTALPTGAASTIGVQTAAGCPWTAASHAEWISVPVASGSGPTAVPFSVTANTSPLRTGSLTVAGSTIAVSQASTCTWRLAPPSASFPADGGRGSVLVIVSGACTWTAASTVGWITMEAGQSGSGDGLVQFLVSPNSGPARSGIVRIAGIDLNVQQAAR